MLEIKQLFDPDRSAFSYLLWDAKTRAAAMIDPVASKLTRDLGLLRHLELKLVYILQTHVHEPGELEAQPLRYATGARVVAHENSGAHGIDRQVAHNDMLFLGAQPINVIFTPGHTKADVSYWIQGAIFSGDTLLIHGCGRTDCNAGDAGTLYDSITEKLFVLPDSTVVYPAHDSRGMKSTTIGEEKRYNPRLGGHRSRDAFIYIMNRANLEQPKNCQQTVPPSARLNFALY